MTGWGLRRIQKVEMSRNEIKKKEKERKMEKVLRLPSDKNVIEMPVGAVV